jgi:hypothetical protein
VDIPGSILSLPPTPHVDGPYSSGTAYLLTKLCDEDRTLLEEVRDLLKAQMTRDLLQRAPDAGR